MVIKLLKSYFLKPDPVLSQLQARSLATMEEDEDYIVIREKIPRQFMSEEERAVIESTAETVEDILTTSIVLSFILNLLLSGVMSQLWNIFNTLQIILLLPHLAVLMPANVELVEEVINQIVNFSPIDKVWLQEEVVAPVLDLDLEETEVGKNLEDNSLLLNVLELLLIITVLGVLISFCACCKCCVIPRCCPCC